MAAIAGSAAPTILPPQRLADLSERRRVNQTDRLKPQALETPPQFAHRANENVRLEIGWQCVEHTFEQPPSGLTVAVQRPEIVAKSLPSRRYRGRCPPHLYHTCRFKRRHIEGDESPLRSALHGTRHLVPHLLVDVGRLRVAFLQHQLGHEISGHAEVRPSKRANLDHFLAAFLPICAYFVICFWPWALIPAAAATAAGSFAPEAAAFFSMAANLEPSPSFAFAITITYRLSSS